MTLTFVSRRLINIISNCILDVVYHSYEFRGTRHAVVVKRGTRRANGCGDIMAYNSGTLSNGRFVWVFTYCPLF